MTDPFTSWVFLRTSRNPKPWFLRAHLDTTTAWSELMFSLSSSQEERDGERRPLLLDAPLPIPTAIELSEFRQDRSADFCPLPAVLAGPERAD